MKKILLIVLSLYLLGCAKGDTGPLGPTGPKGDTGAQALIGTKTYTGVCTVNPETISCPEIVNTATQVIDCYILWSGTSYAKLPMTNYAGGSVYENLATIDAVSHQVTFLTVIDGVTAGGAALVGCGYKIEIKTFATSAGATAYRKSIGK